MSRLNFIWASLIALLIPAMASAQDAPGLDARINAIFADYTGWYVSFIFAPFPGTDFSWIALWLVVGAVVFTVYFGAIQFSGFRHSIRLVRGDYSDPND
ncbi:MAG: sodium:alanine symporter, partial [Loktanella sp.]|nr:sodium:alanine symporter [Loktanella sp.]